MRRADHAGRTIGKQHRHAICGEYAEQQARYVGYHRIGMRSLLECHHLAHRDAVAPMHLIDAGKARTGQHSIRRAAAVLGDDRRILARTMASVEAGERTGRDAATSPGKAMG